MTKSMQNMTFRFDDSNAKEKKKKKNRRIYDSKNVPLKFPRSKNNSFDRFIE